MDKCKICKKEDVKNKDYRCLYCEADLIEQVVELFQE